MKSAGDGETWSVARGMGGYMTRILTSSDQSNNISLLLHPTADLTTDLPIYIYRRERKGSRQQNYSIRVRIRFTSANPYIIYTCLEFPLGLYAVTKLVLRLGTDGVVTSMTQAPPPSIRT